jgi:exodeoxyribonuclease V alpha subunit
MQIENDYDKEVFNGDIGLIDDVDANTGELVASFRWSFSHLWFRRARHAGARLCGDHSQEPGLGIPRYRDSGTHSTLPDAAAESALYRVTRGKKLVVLVGQKKAVAIAVHNVSGRRRWSKLSEWLTSKSSAIPTRGRVA